MDWILKLLNRNVKIGDIVYGTVSGIQKYGVFVSIEGHQQGLIHISEVKNGYVRDLNELFKIGERIRIMVIDVDEYNQKISLSIRVFNQRRKRTKKNVNKLPFKKHFYTSYQLNLGFEPLKLALPQWVKEAEQQIKLKKI